MERINIKNYKKDYVCYLDEYDEIQLIGSDDIEKIKEFVEEGYIIYGTTVEKVFKKDFVKEIQDKFEDHADEYGYPDMNDYIDYQGEDFKKVKDAIKEFIENLGDTNKCYSRDKNTIIEVE
jgi:hypothetical protein